MHDSQKIVREKQKHTRIDIRDQQAYRSGLKAVCRSGNQVRFELVQSEVLACRAQCGFVDIESKGCARSEPESCDGEQALLSISTKPHCARHARTSL